VAAVDGLLQLQSKSDAAYFVRHVGRELTSAEQAAVERTMLRAYRFQYVLSGVKSTRFPEILARLIPGQEFQRIEGALAPLA
jgi:hypothetical protein